MELQVSNGEQRVFRSGVETFWPNITAMPNFNF